MCPALPKALPRDWESHWPEIQWLLLTAWGLEPMRPQSAAEFSGKATVTTIADLGILHLRP